MCENEIRRQRISWLIDDLEERLEAWTERRRAADCDENGLYVGRHRTQLQAVSSLLAGSVEVLRSELAAIDGAEEVGVFFARSRRVADAVVWLERVWRYFGGRFDQRDDGGVLASTVAAADEVVWSCYRPAYEHPRVQALDLPAQPPPLAYVEPEYSPAARTLDSRLDGELEPSAALSALRDVAGQLPMPLLRLPPWAVGAPWWLIFIAHEVGHHLQHELKLVGPFRRAVEATAAEEGADEDDVGRWGRWGEEIFADLVSLLLVGPWALWAMLEVERRPPRDMTRRRVRYAPALVRLRMMAGMLDRLDIDPAPYLRGLDGILDGALAGTLGGPLDGAAASFALDSKIGTGVPPLLEKSWPGVGRLAKLLRFDAADYAAGGIVDGWAEKLLSNAELRPPKHLDSGRRLAAASLAAWARLVQQAPADLRERAGRLAARTTAAMAASAPPGTRSQTMPSGVDPEPGRRLAARLLELSSQRRQESGGENAGHGIAGEGEDGA